MTHVVARCVHQNGFLFKNDFLSYFEVCGHGMMRMVHLQNFMHVIQSIKFYCQQDPFIWSSLLFFFFFQCFIIMIAYWFRFILHTWATMCRVLKKNIKHDSSEVWIENKLQRQYVYYWQSKFNVYKWRCAVRRGVWSMIFFIESINHLLFFSPNELKKIKI